MSRTQASPAEIMIRKIERGVTNKTIAATLGVTEQAVGFVFQGRSRSPRLRAAIAAALGWPESRIWPDARGRKPRTERQAIQEVA